jgi:hypothetical protein
MFFKKFVMIKWFVRISGAHATEQRCKIEVENDSVK